MYAWHSVYFVLDVKYLNMFLVIWNPLYIICLHNWSMEQREHKSRFFTQMFTNDIINLLNLDFAGLPLTNQGMGISNLWEKNG